MDVTASQCQGGLGSGPAARAAQGQPQQQQEQVVCTVSVFLGLQHGGFEHPQLK